MTLTGAAIAALAASKFVEAAATQAGELMGDVVMPAVLQRAGRQVDAMWARVKRHFAGNGKAERAIAQIEKGQTEPESAQAALNKLAVYLDDDLQDPENAALAGELRQMAQEIVNIGRQEQNMATFNIAASDEARVTAIGGDVNAGGDVNFGDG